MRLLIMCVQVGWIGYMDSTLRLPGVPTCPNSNMLCSAMKRLESSFFAGDATQNFSQCELKEIAKRQPLQVERVESLSKTSSMFGSVFHPSLSENAKSSLLDTIPAYDIRKSPFPGFFPFEWILTINPSCDNSAGLWLQPPWKICQMEGLSHIMENKKCSKPPTRVILTRWY